MAKNEKTKRIEAAISETMDQLRRESKYQPALQNTTLISAYKAHLSNLWVALLDNREARA